MTYPQSKIERGWEYNAAEKAAFALEVLLKRHGIAIAKGSSFEEHVLRVLHIVEQKKLGRLNPQVEDVRPYYRTLIGVYEFATLLLAVQHSPQFGALVPHLRLLNEGQVLQNQPSAGNDQATNKIFELYIAACAIQFGEDLELDDPTHAGGDNPDVLFTVNGRRWGIACKVLHGKSPEGFVTHLIKGLDQIDSSPAEVGFVAFNLKNILPHDEIWPLAPMDGISGNPLTTAAWTHFDAPFQILVYHMQQLGANLVSYLPDNHLETIFAKRKSVKAVLLWGASPSGVVLAGCPTPTSVRALNLQTLAPLSESDTRVFACLDWAIFADSPARGPMPPL